MNIFKKIMYSILFSSFAVMIFSSFFFGIEFFQWAFGISFLTMAVSSVVVASAEVSTGGFPNPYDNDEYYIDWNLKIAIWLSLDPSLKWGTFCL